MTENGAEPADTLARTFAPMLAELEDAELALVQRQNEVARELEAISTELERLAAVKAAMHGQPLKVRRGRRPASSTPAATPSGRSVDQEKQRRREQVMAWARERDGRPFNGGDVAEALDLPLNGTGPVLAGMARAGMLVPDRDDSGQRVYRVAD